MRGSRSSPRPRGDGVGPVQMEIVEPLKQMRFRLEPNDVQPISFDIVLSGVTPPFFEERNLVRNRRTGRDRRRRHPLPPGRLGVGDGDRRRRDARGAPDEWFGFRDHSWGVRQAIGEPLDGSDPVAGDSARHPRRHEVVARVLPASRRHVLRDGDLRRRGRVGVQLGLHQRGRRQPDARPQRRRRTSTTTPAPVRHGRRAGAHDGVGRAARHRGRGARRLRVLPEDGGYGAWEGHKHGRGRARCTSTASTSPTAGSDENLPRLGQFRDTPIRVRDGDAVGYGIMESLIGGDVARARPDRGIRSQGLYT